MKTTLLLLMVAACVSAQAQIPAPFFGMTGQTTGSSTSLTVQYPEQTITSVDSTNFTTSPIATLGHPTTFAWGWVETCNPSVPPCNSSNAYDWSLIDPVLLAAHNQGVSMILTIAWTPQWAIDLSQSGTCHPQNGPGGKSATLCNNPPLHYTGASSDWGVFITELMNHLYHEISFPSPVKYIELWNEANTYMASPPSGFWGPAGDPGYGSRFLRVWHKPPTRLFTGIQLAVQPVLWF